MKTLLLGLATSLMIGSFAAYAISQEIIAEKNNAASLTSQQVL